MQVSTTLNFTDSATPRKLIAVRIKMNANATTSAGSGHELLEIARERAARRGDGREPRAHHRERDEEREHVAVKRLVRVQRGTRGARILADELEVRGRGEHRDDERRAERQPPRAADDARDVARERVDARAEHVADHEEQKQLGTDRAMQRRRAGRVRGARRFRHRRIVAGSRPREPRLFERAAAEPFAQPDGTVAAAMGSGLYSRRAIPRGGSACVPESRSLESRSPSRLRSAPPPPSPITASRRTSTRANP